MVGRLDQRVQRAMIVIAQRHKSERLVDDVWAASHRPEHLCHAVDVAGMGLKSNFDEIAFRQRLCQLQKAAGGRNHLKFGLGGLAVAQFQDGGCGCELNASCAMEGIDLGIVCHAADHYRTGLPPGRDYRSPVAGFLPTLGRIPC